jgi:NTP pyrophosphatase (non-canonical NTP hydrolase)
MDNKTYLELSDRTCKHIGENGVTFGPEQYDLLHATLGIAGESGEIVDAVKKCIIYGKALDKANMREEIGDIMWYIALACRTLDFDLNEILDENIAKLQKRYPDKYSDFHAGARLDKVEATWTEP